MAWREGTPEGGGLVFEGQACRMGLKRCVLVVVGGLGFVVEWSFGPGRFHYEHWF